MEQIAAKLASLVPPQPRDELGAEKGRETGEARRRPLERSTVEVEGAGGILVIGGLLAAAAVAAGATIIARRVQAKRPPASKKERVEGFNGDHKSEQSQIDGSVGVPEDNRVSVKSKDNLFEDDTCDGAKELPNGRVLLYMDQVKEKICRKVDLGLQNGIGEEIRSNDVVDETPGEDNEVASPEEAETPELNECVPALGNEEEEEDEPLPKQQPQFDFAEADNGQSNANELIQSASFEISKQECQSVCYRNEKVWTFLEKPKQSQLEMAECKSDVSRAVELLSSEEMVEQQKGEASQSDLAEEAKSQDISEHQTEQVSDDLGKFEEEIEEKQVPESSPEAAAEEETKEKEEAEASPQQQQEGKEEIEDKSSLEGGEIEEKKEAEASPEGKEHEEEKEDKKDIDTPHEGDEKDEHEEVTEGKKELESSLEGEGDGTHSNQTQSHIIHSEISTEEFSTEKETDEAIEKRQPASFAQEEDGSKNNQIQTNIADPDQHSAEEQSIVNEVEKMGEEKQESDSSPEEAAQMRGDGSGSARVSSAKSNDAATAPSDVVEQAEILLLEVESKMLSDSLITSGEVKDEVHVREAEEKQEESIICRDKIPDNLVHANKAEEKEEQSIIGREKNTENILQQPLMAIIRENALMLEKFLMDIPDRLLVGFLVMALTIVLLQYTKPLSRLYHMISRSEENLQEN